MTPQETADICAEVFVELCGRLDRLISLQEQTNDLLNRLETTAESRQLFAKVQAALADKAQATAVDLVADDQPYPSDNTRELHRGLGALRSLHHEGA